MLNIVVAPSEYNRIGERHTKRIVKYLKMQKIEYSVYFSDSFESLKNNIKELISYGENEYVVVGDDLVLSEAISSFKDLNKLKIGIVPTSKKDDFASYLGISSNPIDAIKDILEKHIESVDVMVVNDMTVLNSVVVGASVEIFHHYNQYKWKNFISKHIATKKYGNSYNGVELVIENKTKSKKENIFELVVANGGFSKGKRLSPLSNVQDGLFNLNYTINSSKPENKTYIKKSAKGDHIYSADTKQFWLNKIKISNPDKKIKALIDGKICNLEELNISILEKSLKIYKKQ